MANGNIGQSIIMRPVVANTVLLEISAVPITNSTSKVYGYALYNSTLTLSLKYAVNNQIVNISGYKATEITDSIGNSKVTVYLINATKVPAYYVIQYIPFNLQDYGTYMPQVQRIINSIKLG